MKYLMAALFVALGISPECRATDYTSTATINATFRCPEELPNDEARAAELKGYSDWVRSQHPDWPMPEILGTRLYILERNHCDQTLAAIKTSKAIH